ncbi:MAG: MarR family EPS-associated transcriptional regulator [Burkholderiaceae bacterium]
MIEHPPGPEAAQDAHLRLLLLIEQHPDYSQRRLAEAMGVSLGKAHYLLKALFDKGLVKAGKFTRSPDKLKYVYALTPSGVAHRLQLMRRFLKSKEREFIELQSEIEQLRAALAAEAPRANPPNPSGDSMPR